MKKLIRITSVPLSIEKLLGSQLSFMNRFFEVTAVSSDEVYLKKVAEELGVKYHAVEMTRAITPLQDLKSMYNMVLFFRKEKPHIIHSHTPKAGLISMIAGAIAGVPVRLHTVAGLPLLETKGFKRRILNAVEWFTYKCATKIYPNSTKLQEIIIEQKFCSPQKVLVIGNGSSNGIDLDHFNPKKIAAEEQIALKKKLGIAPDDFVFIFLGRVVRDKGINELVSAFKMILEHSLFSIENEAEKETADQAQILYQINFSNSQNVSDGNKILSEQFFSNAPSITGLKLRNRLGKVLYRNSKDRPSLVLEDSVMDFSKDSQDLNTTITHQSEKRPLPKVKLLLIGPLEQELNPILGITLLEIEKNPHILTTGFVQDVRPYLALSNCLVLPSYREGFPNAVLQAGAMELPCIVTDINGCNEIISDGENGLIVPVKSEEEIKNAMLRMLLDQKLAAQLKANSRKMIEQKYSHQKIWDEMRQEYNSFF
jgi:glycosyltransferase involved in cell wall biosynthesis